MTSLGKGIPEVLYHYTNVDALALILRNRTIKFNPLTVMDDLQEERLNENYRLARFLFASSWTGDDKDNEVSMWKMYGSWENGVRIKLRRNPFKLHSYAKQDFAKLAAQTVNGSDNAAMELIIPNREPYISCGMPIPYTLEELLIPVEYTDDKEKLNPTIISYSGDNMRIETLSIGKYKAKAWCFQKEYRYRFFLMPQSLSEFLRNGEIAAQVAMQRLLDNKYELPIKGYFLDIDDVAFSTMEVTLSPKLSEGKRIIVECLKEKYNPTMDIIDSMLTGQMR